VHRLRCFSASPSRSQVEPQACSLTWACSGPREIIGQRQRAVDEDIAHHLAAALFSR